MSHPRAHAHGGPGEAAPAQHLPRLIAWELTRSCMLACKHCRAAAKPTPYSDELSTDECKKLLDNIASFAKPIMILTGGEPMLRADIYEIAAYATGLGLPAVMAPCGMLIDDETAARIAQAGIRRISISLDGATAESHDAFRGVPGAFAGSMRGLQAAKRAGLEFQINTTVTTHNRGELEKIMDLAISLGARVFNPFLLVPTGRGKELADQELSPQQYEEALHWLADQQAKGRIEIRVTCAPHYQRILRQTHGAPEARAAKGCMGGQSFAFISHRGKVQICGFLDIECGDVRREKYDFRKIWETSEVFLKLRDLDGYHGRCGYCEFRKVCGGCRARAFAVTGDWLDEEPFCSWQPRAKGHAHARLSEPDAKILSAVQAGLAVTPRPFDAVGEPLGLSGEDVVDRLKALRESGVIRRVGAVFDSRHLGYASTLVAARVPADRLDEIAAVVSALPGVTHNYSRRHAYNLWFTLTAESAARIDETLAALRERTGIADIHSLPALRLYKIRVFFGADDPAPAPSPAPAASEPVALDEADKALVRLLQEDLPLTARPFEALAAQLGTTEAAVIAKVQGWLAGGVMRRLAAVVRHHKLGYSANGMAVFRASAEVIDEWGQRLAKLPQVSHCYRRPPLPDFPYTLFAMTHGQSTDEVRALIDRAAADLGAADYDVLFSDREFKKVSMRYFPT